MVDVVFELGFASHALPSMPHLCHHQFQHAILPMALPIELCGELVRQCLQLPLHVATRQVKRRRIQYPCTIVPALERVRQHLDVHHFYPAWNWPAPVPIRAGVHLSVLALEL